LLVTGSVIIGRREEGKEVGVAGTAGVEPSVLASDVDGDYTDEPDAPPPSVGRGLPSGARREAYENDSSNIEMVDPNDGRGGDEWAK
jgi:hypothetical protein